MLENRRYFLSCLTNYAPLTRWFHGKMDRDKAEKVLQPRVDGLYLVRESNHYPGDYTLCVVWVVVVIWSDHVILQLAVTWSYYPWVHAKLSFWRKSVLDIVIGCIELVIIEIKFKFHPWWTSTWTYLPGSSWLSYLPK